VAQNLTGLVCNFMALGIGLGVSVMLLVSKLQCVAVCCSVLQRRYVCVVDMASGFGLSVGVMCWCAVLV